MLLSNDKAPNDGADQLCVEYLHKVSAVSVSEEVITPSLRVTEQVLKPVGYWVFMFTFNVPYNNKAENVIFTFTAWDFV